MKKGFTLIELLAVIVILAIILVISIPQINKVINNSKTSSYNNQIEIIKNATDLYKTKYIDEILNINSMSVNTNTLIEKGLLKNLINPITNKEFENGLNININTINGNTEYEVYESPELVDGLIPVYYDENNMVWKKADKNNVNNNWYDYANKIWANAVTVSNTNRNTYINASIGTVISMSDINTMWVWIPRYSYKIPPGSTEREIDITFETKYVDKNNGDAVNAYYTHPAFTFGDKELSGIWVGKFETTGSASNPTILPNLFSFHETTPKTAFESIKNNMQNNTTTYGFTNDGDIHMMKNTEWGAVAYLSHSGYGLNSQIYKNNSNGYFTGRSGGNVSGSQIKVDGKEYISGGFYTYDGKCAITLTTVPGIDPNCTSIGNVISNKNLSYKASTSGTIYGIYDMAGGSWDFVMGMYMPNPIPLTGIIDYSGYSSSTTNSQYNLLNLNNKYYDRYLSSLKLESYIKGDATYETNNWYSSLSSMATATQNWLIRGSHASNSNVGIFSYYPVEANYTGASFHIVISP